MASAGPRNWFKRLIRKTKETAENQRSSEYRAVSIHCTNNACQAAKDKLGERFLSAEAPLLPLRECDRPDQCDCRYKHYADRRGTMRRRSDHGLTATDTDPDRAERRYQTDRRAQDDEDGAQPFSVHDDSYYEHVGDTIRTRMLDASESDGGDPRDSGRFDKSKSWGPDSEK